MAPVCPPMRAHWRHLANAIELVLPSAHPNPQPNGKSIDSAVFAQMTAECPYTLQWDAPSPLKIAYFRGICGPHQILGSFAPPESSAQTTS